LILAAMFSQAHKPAPKKKKAVADQAWIHGISTPDILDLLRSNGAMFLTTQVSYPYVSIPLEMMLSVSVHLLQFQPVQAEEEVEEFKKPQGHLVSDI